MGFLAAHRVGVGLVLLERLALLGQHPLQRLYRLRSGYEVMSRAQVGQVMKHERERDREREREKERARDGVRQQRERERERERERVRERG